MHHLFDYVYAFGAYLLPFLALILVLVVTHELGHFAAARALGISVAEFAAGFGPLLWSRKDRKGCQWSLRLVPLGGFVRFLGDENAASANVGSPENVDPALRSGLFQCRPPLHRIVVLVAGPAANLVTGILVLTFLYAFYGRQYSPPILAEVASGGPAMTAGFQVGDRVVSIDRTAVERFEDIQRIVASQPGRRLSFLIEREGALRTIEIVPEKHRMTTNIGVEIEVGRIGIVSRPSEPERVSPASAVLLGGKDIWFFTRSTVSSIGEMLVGLRSIEEAGGPIRIVQLSGDSAKQGLPAFAVLVAVLSVSLAVFNLLPVPILDGGQVVICAVEALMRRKPPEWVMSLSYNAGFVAVLGLVVVVSYNDVVSLYRHMTKPNAPVSDLPVPGDAR